MLGIFEEQSIEIIEDIRRNASPCQKGPPWHTP
jgi:hypothetical protein